MERESKRDGDGDGRQGFNGRWRSRAFVVPFGIVRGQGEQATGIHFRVHPGI
jgi:hypothetical protein